VPPGSARPRDQLAGGLAWLSGARVSGQYLVELEHHGGQRVRRAYTWWVMRDPAGLLFCVIPEPGGTLNDSNARRWE
jgi:hypothetical protein